MEVNHGHNSSRNNRQSNIQRPIPIFRGREDANLEEGLKDIIEFRRKILPIPEVG